MKEFVDSAQSYFNQMSKKPKRVNFHQYFTYIKDQNGKFLF
jgi:hypothetical protein